MTLPMVFNISHWRRYLSQDMEGRDSLQCLFSVLLVSKFFSCVTVELIQLLLSVLMVLHLPGPDHFISPNTLSRWKWQVIWNCSKVLGVWFQKFACHFPPPLVKPIYFKGSFSTMSLLPCESISHSVVSDSAAPWSVACQASSQTRDRTQVSCIAGGFFTSWATREALEYWRE